MSSPGRIVILVVDDDDAVRMVARRFLEIQGAAVLEAAGADEAIQTASANPGPIDILVTDLGMPGMGGGELAAHLRSVRPALKVVFMSGEAPPELGGERSSTAYLQKPFNARDMAAVIEQVRAATDAPGVLE